MPPAIDLDAYRDEITRRYLHSNVSVEKIAELYRGRLGSCSKSTVDRHLTKWGVKRRQIRSIETEEVKASLDFWYYDEAAPDKIIIEEMIKEGHSVSARGIAQLRMKYMGHRRLPRRLHADAEAVTRRHVATERENYGKSLGRQTLGVMMKQARYTHPVYVHPPKRGFVASARL
jgi:hypothetical protein